MSDTPNDDEQFFREAREIVARGNSSPRYDAKGRIDYRRAALLLKLERKVAELRDKLEAAERRLADWESEASRERTD